MVSQKNKLISFGLDGFTSSKGKILYGKKIRYMLIRPETLIGFQKKLGNASKELLYTGGFEGGSSSARKYKAIYHLPTRELLLFLIHMGSLLGWGSFVLNKFDQKLGCFVVDVHDSVFADAFGRSVDPVCHLTCGVLGGFGDVLFSRPVMVEEILCKAKGDRLCRF